MMVQSTKRAFPEPGKHEIPALMISSEDSEVVNNRFGINTLKLSSEAKLPSFTCSSKHLLNKVNNLMGCWFEHYPFTFNLDG